MVVDSSSLLAKYLDEKDGNSLKFMQRMIYLIFSEVVYQRELLPQEHFTEKNILGCKLHIPNPSRDSRQRALHHHLKGAAEAVEGKRLKQYHLMVHKDRYDPSAADEVFIMDVVYAENDEDEAAMQMSCGDQPEVRVCYTGVEQLQKQAKDVFRNLSRGLSTLDRITRNVSFSFYIMYRDGVDRAYHPAGYVQAPRRYALPDAAEIGDMGMVHAREHACLLKVKSMLLEDGFQLMQRNAATQRTDTQPQSVPMEEGGEEGEAVSSSDVMSTEKDATLGMFAPHDDNEWAETPEEPARDQRSTGGVLRSSARDQRSLTAASAKTARFGESVSILDLSMHSDDGLNGDNDDNDFAASEDDDEAPSEDVGTATIDDFAPTQKQSQTRMDEGGEEEEGGTQQTRASTFASTISMVTKKLMEKEERKEMEKMREDEEKENEKEAAPSVTASFIPSPPSDSAIDAGSEASEEKPARRVSLRKRKSLPKVPEESSTTGSSDGRPSAEATAEDAVVTAAAKQDTSSGKDADAESPAMKETRRTTRRKASRERPPATLAEETVETPEKEAADASTKRAARPQRGSRKPADTVAEDSVVPETPQETVQSDSQSTGRRGRSGGRAAVAAKKKEEEVKEKKEVKRGGRGRGKKAAEESVEEESSGSGASSGDKEAEDEEELPVTPQRGVKRPAEPAATPTAVKKTPGEAIKRTILFSQDLTQGQ